MPRIDAGRRPRDPHFVADGVRVVGLDRVGQVDRDAVAHAARQLLDEDVVAAQLCDFAAQRAVRGDLAVHLRLEQVEDVRASARRDVGRRVVRVLGKMKHRRASPDGRPPLQRRRRRRHRRVEAAGAVHVDLPLVARHFVSSARRMRLVQERCKGGAALDAQVVRRLAAVKSLLLARLAVLDRLGLVLRLDVLVQNVIGRGLELIAALAEHAARVAAEDLRNLLELHRDVAAAFAVERVRVREGAAPVRFFRRALQAREVRGMLRRARDAMGLERFRVVRVDGERFVTTVALRLARARALVLVHEFAVLDLHCTSDGHEREALGRVPRRVDVARARSLEVVVLLLTVHL
mmetsp:Transcript_23121/g.78116  ORF Transcript_23121/g.78116 Transcript_23121/m.78116 type:complete len:349 (-) Transcript_23121:104-1150(-)